jgi:hypothetical protein
MLAMAENLNLATGGPSIYNHYVEAVDPDKQPPSGPLDGAGRRSLYLEVRRNFLSDFLTCFDFPRPNNPAGSKGRWFGRKGVRRTLRCAPPRFSLRGGGSAAPDNGGPGFAQNSGGGGLDLAV